MRHLISHLALLIAWLLVHAPVLGWLLRRWSATEGHVHLALALILLAGVASTVDPVAVLDRLARPMRASPAAMALAALPPVGAAVGARWLPLDVLPAAALVVSAYGVVGLFTSPATWRSLRGAALLGAALLPLTAHLDVFLGYPLRAATASAVAAALGSDVTAGTVLTLDGRFAHVDLPCSGVRSLWSGAVVLLGGALAWQRPVGLRFGGVAIGVSGLLVAANAGRILALVALDHRLGLPLVADVLHLPLGVVGFGVAVGLGLLAVRRLPDRPAARATVAAARTWGPGSAVVLGAAWLGSWLVPIPEAPPGTPLAAVVLPVDLVLQPPSPAERAFAAEHGAQVVKARIMREDVRGSVVVVTSRSWLAHHVPTWCHEAAGWTLQGEHPARIADMPVRWAVAERGADQAHAMWWFQSADHVTDDHTERILSGLIDGAPWVLVSLLLDAPADATDPAVAELVTQLRAAVAPTEIP